MPTGAPWPNAEPTLAEALLAEAFWLLLAEGRPVDIDRLADSLRQDSEVVDDALARLEQAGRVRRNPVGQVVGSHGLSSQPTSHQLRLDGKRRWVWCAWDAVGILGALSASGRIRSTSPLSGVPIELAFDAGRPPASEAVVFLATEDCCASVVDDWCPLVNFFEHAEAAVAWAGQHGVKGRALSLEEATATGTAAWRSWLAARPDPTRSRA